MTIELNNKEISVQIKYKTMKNVVMSFIDSDTLEVRCNKYIREKDIMKILESNRSSLEKMLAKKEEKSNKEIFFQYLGKSYTRIFDGETKNVEFIADNVIAKDEKTLNNFYKKECIRIFNQEVERILMYFPSVPKFQLVIRTMKTRWGVNNLKSHTITLNSELLKKDIDLLDYVIIHELCHFFEMNHSNKFWNHVAKYYPNYKEARKRLRG